jgi:hypothetical protein
MLVRALGGVSLSVHLVQTFGSKLVRSSPAESDIVLVCTRA